MEILDGSSLSWKTSWTSSAEMTMPLENPSGFSIVLKDVPFTGKDAGKFLSMGVLFRTTETVPEKKPSVLLGKCPWLLNYGSAGILTAGNNQPKSRSRARFIPGMSGRAGVAAAVAAVEPSEQIDADRRGTCLGRGRSVQSRLPGV